MRIDAHQHYWLTGRGDYGWLTSEQGILYAVYMPEKLQDSLQRYYFERTIVVQAAPTLEETQFLLSLYDEYESIAGVVGWLDLDSPQFSEQYAKFRGYKGFVGFRPMLQDLPDSWILRPQVMQNMEQLVKDDFPLDLRSRSASLELDGSSSLCASCHRSVWHGSGDVWQRLASLFNDLQL